MEGLGTATWLSTRGVLAEQSSAVAGRSLQFSNFTSQAECREEGEKEREAGSNSASWNFRPTNSDLPAQQVQP